MTKETSIVLAAILVYSLVGLAVFGFVAMDHQGGHPHSNCLATAIYGYDVACPDESSGVLSLNFHLNALKELSAAIFGGGSAGLPLLLFLPIFLLLSAAAAAGARRFRMPSPELFYCSRQFVAADESPASRRFSRWLALHENSPSLI